MRNPFRTRIFLLVSRAGTWKVEIPFVGKVKSSLIPWKKVRGEKIDFVVVDEITGEKLT